MEQERAVPARDRGPLSLAEAADAIAQLPDAVLGIGTSDRHGADPAIDEEGIPSGEGEDSTGTAEEAAATANDTDTDDLPGENDRDEDGEDPLVTVALPDGETRELPLSEVVKGYSRTADHEQRTVELAEERERLQQDEQQFAQALERWLVAQALDEPPPPELQQQDAAEYGRQQAAWQQRAATREAVLRYYDAMTQQNELQRTTRQAMGVEHEKRRLREAWPEIADPRTGPQLRQDIYHGLAEEYGFTPTDLNNLYNHRTVLMARDALAYRRMQKARAGARGKLREKPVVMKPGAKQGRASIAAGRHAAKRERLRQHGTLRDAAAVFEDMDL